jgi:hypothetical protein
MPIFDTVKPGLTPDNSRVQTSPSVEIQQSIDVDELTTIRR